MRELLLQASFGGMLVCGVLSLWPFQFARRWKSWNLYVPVAGLALYGTYEFALPAEVELGGRMAITVALLLFLCINGMAKVALLASLQEKAGGSRRRLRAQPQRRLQLAVALPIALACALWAWRSIS